MPDEKAKAGRPKKEETKPLVDEEAEVLMMAEGGASATAQQDASPVSVDDLSAQYKRIFTKWSGATSQGGFQINTINNMVSDLQNPFVQNQRLKRLLTLPAEFDKANLVDAIKDPGNNEQMLRAAVGSLSSSNFLFYKILRESTDIPLFKHQIIPPCLDKVQDYKKPAFVRERKLVHEWVREFNVVTTFKRIAMEVKREGKVCYMLRNSFNYDKPNEVGVNYAYLQKMPTDYIKLTYLGKLGYGASFNMMWFFTPGTDPRQFGPWLQQVWEDMNATGIVIEDKKKMKQLNPFLASTYAPLYKGKKMKTLLEKSGNTFYYWVTLPQDLFYVFSSDPSVPYQAPDTAGLVLDLQNLTSFTDASALLTVQRLCQFLTAEAEIVPTSGVGRTGTYISADTLDSLNNEFDNKVSENVTSFFAPLKNFKLHSLDTSSVNGSDILTAATTNFLVRSGDVLHPSDSKPSVFQIKVAVKELASQYAAVTAQFEQVMNFILKRMLDLSYEWRIHIFGDIFSIDDERTFLKESVAGGAMYFLPKLLAYEDMDVMEADAIVKYLTSIGLYEKLVTPTQIMTSKLGIQAAAKTKEMDDEMANGTKKVGRPKSKDPDSDAAYKSEDQGDNIGEIKNEYFSDEDDIDDEDEDENEEE